MPDTLNILYVGTLPPHPGGSAIVGAQLLSGLARAGHRVQALAPATPEALRHGDRFAESHPGIGVTRFPVPWFENSPDQPAGASYRELEAGGIRAGLVALLAAERPDLIVIGRESFAWTVPDLAHDHGVPSVLVVHGTMTAGMKRGTIPADSTSALLANFHKASAIVLVARHLVETYRQLGFPDARVVQNGVDLERFAPGEKSSRLLRELTITPDDVVLVHASNLKELKRPLDIVQSAAHALRTDPRLMYLIVGDGPLRAEVELEARRRGIADRFRFTGWVEHERVPDYLRLADAVLMPSESEAFALVYLETMACGRLLLASDIPAAREAVRDGVTGVLHRKGDVSDLAAKTLAAAADRERREAIGARAREAVATEHGIETTVKGYIDVFAQVIAETNLYAGGGRRRATS
jgi:glycosyltransferase involved in cell wall biosynthesis